MFARFRASLVKGLKRNVELAEIDDSLICNCGNHDRSVNLSANTLIADGTLVTGGDEFANSFESPLVATSTLFGTSSIGCTSGADGKSVFETAGSIPARLLMRRISIGNIPQAAPLRNTDHRAREDFLANDTCEATAARQPA